MLPLSPPFPMDSQLPRLLDRRTRRSRALEQRADLIRMMLGGLCLFRKRIGHEREACGRGLIRHALPKIGAFLERTHCRPESRFNMVVVTIEKTVG
jgi:hypothetical protein